MLPELVQKWSESVLGIWQAVHIGVIDSLSTQRYAVAIDDLNPLYFDAEYARQRGYCNVIAPPNYLATLRDGQSPGPAESELLPDGMRPHGRPAIPGLQVMGGGQRLEFITPVCCGEEIVGEKRVTRVDTRPSRAGPLLIVEEEIHFRRSDGEGRLRVFSTSLYRLIPTETGDAHG